MKHSNDFIGYILIFLVSIQCSTPEQQKTSSIDIATSHQQMIERLSHKAAECDDPENMYANSVRIEDFKKKIKSAEGYALFEAKLGLATDYLRAGKLYSAINESARRPNQILMCLSISTLHYLTC